MRSNNYKSVLKHAGLAASVLLLASGAAFGQVSLTAGPANALLPDGTSVPMWGYTCTAATAPTTCAALNTTAATAGQWSPVVITVPTGQDLTITLTNSLTFAGGNIPTSLVIVGQLGGGLGTTATSSASPNHANAQPLTWPIAGDAAGAPVTGVGTPPVQGNRVQSFSTEVAVGTPARVGCRGVSVTPRRWRRPQRRRRGPERPERNVSGPCRTCSRGPERSASRGARYPAGESTEWSREGTGRAVSSRLVCFWESAGWAEKGLAFRPASLIT